MFVQIIVDDSKGRYFAKENVLFCDVGSAHIFPLTTVVLKVIPYIEDEDTLITNSLAAEAKLVKSAKTRNKEHSEWFVLKTSALFKGLREKKKLNSVNCQVVTAKSGFTGLLL